MKTYKYKAKDKNGKIVRGSMSAENEVELHETLKKEEKYLIRAWQKEKETAGKRLSAAVLAEFCRNLHSMIAAGIPLVKAVQMLAEDEVTPEKQRKLYHELERQLRLGVSLSEVMEQQGETFPRLLIHMIKSGEASGRLEQIALEMSHYYEKEHQLTGKIQSSLLYPKILCVMIVVVVMIIMGFVMPQFYSLFAKMENLPKSTLALLAISNFVKTKWYVVILGMIFLVMIGKVTMLHPKVRYLLDKCKVHLPVIGNLMKVIYTARFARILASMYAAGIPIVDCIEIAKTTINNIYIENQFNQVISDVCSGRKLSTAVEKVDGFSGKLSSTIRVGEESGALDSMLVAVAGQMEYDSEIALNRLVGLLEPVMIVVMAAIVGFIMISVIQPIYYSYETISKMYK